MKIMCVNFQLWYNYQAVVTTINDLKMMVVGMLVREQHVRRQVGPRLVKPRY